ncbi:MAG TPA: carboxypeptidase-like regulatory domain-containing protein [Blastocatellia bacterium]|nr:carboxypeptidase-like regulatory domain-containing protein [Blastocatellia bacterium]
MSKLMMALMIIALSAAAQAQPPGGKIVGRVIERETLKTLPAEIALAGRDRRQLFLRHTKAAETGLFEIADLPAGDLYLTTKLEGYAVEHLSVSLNDGETRYVEFYLSKGKTLRGTINDRSQRPLGGVRVNIIYLTEETDGGPIMASYQWERGETVTDRAGRFEIRNLHPEKEFIIEASAPQAAAATVSAPLRFKSQDRELSVTLSVDSPKRPAQ